MRKEYIVYVDRYDYFDGFCGHRYHESGYETLGSNPIEALKAYRKLKSFDYDHGDSYQRTRNIQVIWVADKVTNNHNFYTHPYERLQKFPVVGWDGSVIDHIVASEKELYDKSKQLHEVGYYYNLLDNNIRSFEPLPDDVKDVEVDAYALPYESNEFNMFDIDPNDTLPFQSIHSNERYEWVASYGESPQLTSSSETPTRQNLLKGGEAMAWVQVVADCPKCGYSLYMDTSTGDLVCMVCDYESGYISTDTSLSSEEK